MRGVLVPLVNFVLVGCIAGKLRGSVTDFSSQNWVEIPIFHLEIHLQRVDLPLLS